jgi:hypothetical protein
MGTPSTGRGNIFAVRKTNAWGSALAVAGEYGVQIDSDGLNAGHTVEQLRDESLGNNFVHYINVGREAVAGALAGRARYQQQALLMALVLGDPQAKVGAGPYDMSIYPADNLDGLYACYASLFTSAVVAEIPSLKFNGMSLSADYGMEVQAEYRAIGDRLVKTGDATIVNTTGDLAAVTIDPNALDDVMVFCTSSYFWLNTSSGAALAAGDEIGITTFAFDYELPQDLIYASGALAQTIVEPKCNAMPEPTMNFSLVEYTDVGTTVTADDFKSALNTNDTFKAKLRLFKNANYALDIYFPKLKVTACAPAVSEPGRIVTPVECACLKADSAPSGMAHAGPVYFVLTNQEPNNVW